MRGALALAVMGLASDTVALDTAKAVTQYAARVWGPEHGLRQKDVLAIAQTPDGYLWLGTMEGLIRFDGVRFTVFDKNNTPGLLQSYIWTLLVDGKGTLWIGTYGGGLSRFENGRFSAYTTQHGLASDLVRSLCEARNGGLWIGTSAGLSRLKDGRFTSYTMREGLGSDNVRAVHEDRRGVVWIGTTAGLDRLDGDLVSHVPTVDAPGRTAPTPVYALAEGRDGSLWVGTYGSGLNQLKSGRLTAWRSGDGLVNDAVLSLVEDRDGALWIGTSGGMSRLLDGRFESYTVREGLSNSSVYALFEDREGLLWAGTTGVRGLNRLGNGRFLPYGPPEGMASDRAWSIHQARDGSVWVAGNNGSLARFQDGRFTQVSHWPRSRTLRTVYETSDGSLWIGSEGGGLTRLRAGQVVTYGTKDGLPSDTVWALTEGEDGALWIGTEGGLTRMKDRRFEVFRKAQGLPSDVVRTVYRGRDGSLWLGTYGGLAHLQGGQFTVYRKRDGLSSDLVRSIYQDAEGVLWVGTLGGGLNRIKDGKITAYSVKDGLFDDVIWSILEDGDGRLWMSCNKGLFSVRKADLEAYDKRATAAVPVESYDVSDGLRGAGSSGGSYPAACRTRDGKLWFPTVSGVVVADPRQIRPEPVRLAVTIEEVLADGRPLSGAPMTAGPGKGELELHYTALSFEAPERISFRYQLEGFDRDWVEAGSRRTAFYTNIPPGPYRFRVAARVGQGPWTENAASVAIMLAPHFYQTKWFYALMGMGAVALVLGLHALRVRGLTARERELERRVRENMAHIKVLCGLLPICSSCKSIRDDKGYWSQMEHYISQHSDVEFSHGICPDCLSRLYPDYSRKRRSTA